MFSFSSPQTIHFGRGQSQQAATTFRKAMATPLFWFMGRMAGNNEGG